MPTSRLVGPETGPETASIAKGSPEISRLGTTLLDAMTLGLVRRTRQRLERKTLVNDAVYLIASMRDQLDGLAGVVATQNKRDYVLNQPYSTIDSDSTKHEYTINREIDSTPTSLTDTPISVRISTTHPNEETARIITVDQDYFLRLESGASATSTVDQARVLHEQAQLVRDHLDALTYLLIGDQEQQ
jgi:hypothetical protein